MYFTDDAVCVKNYFSCQSRRQISFGNFNENSFFLFRHLVVPNHFSTPDHDPDGFVKIAKGQ
jgi:hypothetical protein